MTIVLAVEKKIDALKISIACNDRKNSKVILEDLLAIKDKQSLKKYGKFLLELVTNDFEIIRKLAVRLILQVPFKGLEEFGQSTSALFQEAQELLNSSWTISRIKGASLMDIITATCHPSQLLNVDKDWFNYFRDSLQLQMGHVKLDFNSTLKGNPIHGSLMMLVSLFKSPDLTNVMLELVDRVMELSFKFFEDTECMNDPLAATVDFEISESLLIEMKEKGNLDFTKSDQDKVVNCFWRCLKCCFVVFDKITNVMEDTSEKAVITTIGNVLIGVLLKSNHSGVLKSAQESFKINCSKENSKVIAQRLNSLLNFEMEFKVFSRFDGKSIGYSMAVLELLKALDDQDLNSTVSDLLQSFSSRNLDFQKVIIQILTLIVKDKIGKNLDLDKLLHFALNLDINKEFIDFKWNGNFYQLLINLMERRFQGDCICVAEMSAKFLEILENYDSNEGLSAILIQMISKSYSHNCDFQRLVYEIAKSKNGNLRNLSAKTLCHTGNLHILIEKALSDLEHSDMNQSHGILLFLHSALPASKKDLRMELLQLQKYIKESVQMDIMINLSLMHI